MAIDQVKIKEITDYFADEVEELGKQMIDAEYLYEVLKEEVMDLKDSKQRGTFKYTVDMFNNLITMSSQKQSILKDQFTIKKSIVDLAMKDKSTEGAETELKDVLLSIMRENRGKENKRSQVNDEVIENIVKIKNETNNEEA